MGSDMDPENTDQARHERHLAEIEERMERFHRESQQTTEQLMALFNAISVKVQEDMEQRRRDVVIERERRRRETIQRQTRIVQLLSHDGDVIALYGDGQYRRTPVPAPRHLPERPVFPEGAPHA